MYNEEVERSVLPTFYNYYGKILVVYFINTHWMGINTFRCRPSILYYRCYFSTYWYWFVNLFLISRFQEIMTIVYTDYGVIKTKNVPEFTTVGGYIKIKNEYLLGKNGGRIHISQLIQKDDGKGKN